MLIFKKYKFLFIFIFFLILATNAFSKNIQFIGLNKLTLEDISSIVSYDIDYDYNLDEVNTIIRQLYDSELIYDITYSEDKNNFLIQITESSIIENIYITGNVRIDDDTLLSLIKSKKDFLINKQNILDDVKLLENLLISKGFLNSSVSASSEIYSNNRVNLIFHISEGDYSKLSLITFIGNKTFSGRTISSVINSKTSSKLNPFAKGSNLNRDIFDYDKNKIIKFYQNQGFRNVEVSYSLNEKFKNNFQLIFYINENYRSLITDIKYDLSDEFLQQISFKELQKIFNKKLLKNKYFYNYENIVEYLVEINKLLINSNIFNKFIDVNINYTNNDIQLLFFEQETDPRLINKISFYGNTITKENVLRSKVNSTPGSYYNKFQLDSDVNKIASYKFINKVDTNIIENNNSIDIEFLLNENKKTGNLLFAATANSDVGLGAAIGIKDVNLFGSGNEINSSFKVNLESTMFDILYKSYSFNSPSLYNTYRIYNSDSDLTNSFGYKSKSYGFSYDLNFKHNDILTSSVGLGYSSNKSYDPKNNTDLAITDSIGTANNITLNYNATFDTTNDSLYPNEGSLNQFSIEFSPDDISNDAYYKVNYTNNLYFKRSQSSDFFFIINKLGLAESLNSKLKTHNAFSLGGLNFKGFDYRGIGPNTSSGVYLGGNKFVSSTIGYGSKFLFDEKDNINLKFFMTNGSIWDSDYQSSNFELRTSVGISFDIITTVGPISLSYATPLKKNNNDDIQRFNFTIGTSF